MYVQVCDRSKEKEKAQNVKSVIEARKSRDPRMYTFVMEARKSRDP